MKSRTVLYLGIVVVLIAGLIGGLQLDQRSARTEAAGAGGSPGSGGTQFGGIGSTGSMAGQQSTPSVTVESLESAQDFYASFLAARATGRPEMVYEAKTLLEGCEDGFTSLQLLRAVENASAQSPLDPEKNAALMDGRRKMTKAIDELNRRCRGFGAVRDWRALQKELIQQASGGTGPLANLMRVEGYPPHGQLTQEAKDAISAALRSGDRTTIELALRSLRSSLSIPGGTAPIIPPATLRLEPWTRLRGLSSAATPCAKMTPSFGVYEYVQWADAAI